MLIPNRVIHRRRNRNGIHYLIGSTEFIEEVYDKCIKNAEQEGNLKQAEFFRQSKKTALRQAYLKNRKFQNDEQNQMQ